MNLKSLLISSLLFLYSQDVFSKQIPKIIGGKVAIGIETNMGTSWSNKFGDYLSKSQYIGTALFTGALGLNVVIRFTNYFSLVPGVFYSVYGSAFTFPAYGITQTNTSRYGTTTTKEANYNEQISMHYFQFPLLLQAKIPIEKSAIYFESGLSMAANLYGRYAVSKFVPSKKIGELDEDWDHVEITYLLSSKMSMFHFNIGYIGNISKGLSYRMGLNYSHGLSNFFKEITGVEAITKAVQFNFGLIINLKS